MPAKPHLNLVFIGHVDHGKSTTVGRILYDTGNIDPHELENLKKLAEQMGKATFEFAFVMDQVKEEDRKSTRLNSSHSQISYAVFCLKKKKKLRIRVVPTLSIKRHQRFLCAAQPGRHDLPGGLPRLKRQVLDAARSKFLYFDSFSSH